LLPSAYPVVSAKPGRLFQQTGLKPDILGVVEPSTTTAGGDLKEPDKRVLPKGRMDF
jgi:hypothetical protein